MAEVKKLTDAVADQKRSIDEFKVRLEAQDKLLANISAWASVGVSGAGFLAALLGALITGIVIYFSWHFGSVAKSEAQSAAKDALSEIRSDQERLREKLTTIADETTSRVNQEMRQMSESISNMREELDNYISRIREDHEQIKERRAEVEVIHADLMEKSSQFDEMIMDRRREVGYIPSIPDNKSNPIGFDSAISPIGGGKVVSPYEATMASGKKYLESKKFKEGIDCFTKAAEIAGSIVEKAEAIYHLGWAKLLDGDANGSLECYEKIVSFNDQVENFGTDLEVVIITAYVARALNFSINSHNDEAIVTLNYVLEVYGKRSELEIRMQIAFALHDKARIARRMLDREILDETYDQLTLFGTIDGAESFVANAFIQVAIGYRQLKDAEKALAILSKIKDQYGEFAGNRIRAAVALSIIEKAWTLKMNAKRDAALKEYDEVIREYGTFISNEMAKPIARAYLNKSNIFRELGSYQKSIDTLNEFLRATANLGDEILAVERARAKLYIGKRLQSLKKTPEALAEFAKFVAEYKQSTNEEILNLVGEARKLIEIA